jgi:hypothetical protein
MEKYFSIIEWAYNISVCSSIIPVIAAIFRWKYFNFPLKIAATQALRGLVFSSLGLYFASIGDSHRFLYFLSPCLDIILVSLFAIGIFDFKKEIKWGLALLCLIFIGLLANDYLTTNNPISSNLSTAETIAVIIVSIIMLRKVVLQYKSSVYKQSLIWVISALLIGNLFSILIITLRQSFAAYSTDLMQFWWYLASPFFIVITRLMVAYGFYIIRNKVKN